METKKGLLKKYCNTVDLGNDFEVNRTIINALLEDGYEIISKPTFDSNNYLISETITIYKIHERL